MIKSSQDILCGGAGVGKKRVKGGLIKAAALVLMMSLALSGCGGSSPLGGTYRSSAEPYGTAESIGTASGASSEVVSSMAAARDGGALDRGSPPADAAITGDAAGKASAEEYVGYEMETPEYSAKMIAADTDIAYCPVPPMPQPTFDAPPPEHIQSGTLTAGEWNDNLNWQFFQRVLSGGQDWIHYQNKWKMYPVKRIAVTVLNGITPVSGAQMTLYDANGGKLWESVTDNNGRAWMFYDIFEYQGQSQSQSPRRITATSRDGNTAERKLSGNEQNVAMQLVTDNVTKASLDLMLVFDTTGSMSDELTYLQTELESVVKRVREKNGNLTVRTSVNFYRDVGDEYITRPFDFSENIDVVLRQLREQSADGGGDYEEAVEQALDNAINAHDWAPDSTKLMLLILDAPPHNTSENVAKMQWLLREGARKGIRIIAVASSGIEKDTEFLLRTMAATTGGTYVFLTDDSGVGNSHIEPTIGEYEVEKLNALLIRVICSYL